MASKLQQANLMRGSLERGSSRTATHPFQLSGEDVMQICLAHSHEPRRRLLLVDTISHQPLGQDRRPAPAHCPIGGKNCYQYIDAKWNKLSNGKDPYSTWMPEHPSEYEWRYCWH